jgi:hypothetical protein
VRGDVGVGVTGEAFVVSDLDAGQNQFATGGKRMKIESLSYSIAHRKLPESLVAVARQSHGMRGGACRVDNGRSAKQALLRLRSKE